MKRIASILLVVMFLTACGPTEAQIQAAIEKTQAAAPTITPTDTPVPTSTNIPLPSPTKTKKPSPTPAPTDLPATTITGSGDNVITIPDIYFGKLLVAQVTYDGPSNFVVKSYNATGGYVDLLINTIGDYSGRVPVYLATGDKVTTLEVTASGSWTLEFLPMNSWQLQHIKYGKGTYEGVGDDVFMVYDVDSTVASIKNSGEHNFVVWGYTRESVDLLVNEIGSYDGRVMIGNLVIVVVSSDGKWSFTFE